MVAGGGGGLRLALLDGGRCGLIHGVMIVLCVYVWVDGVCVCVCERERERERERESVSRTRLNSSSNFLILRPEDSTCCCPRFV